MTRRHRFSYPEAFMTLVLAGVLLTVLVIIIRNERTHPEASAIGGAGVTVIAVLAAAWYLRRMRR